MDPVSSSRLLAVGLTCLTLASARGGDPRPPAATSVVILTVDGLRADRLGCYGYERPTTPHLDALAEQAVRYTRAYAASSYAGPSHAAWTTSRTPRSLGVLDRMSPLPVDVPTLTQLLAATHHTIGVVANPFTTSDWGYERGFEQYDQKYTRKAFEDPTAVGVSSQALRFLGKAEAPYYLWVQYMDPTPPFFAHEEFPFEGPANYSGKVASGQEFAELRRGAQRLGAEDCAMLAALYDSELRFVDEQIGRLFDTAREQGWFDDALVVVFGAYGQEFLEHGALGDGAHLADELVHVPLLVKYPGQTEAATVSTPVSLLDVAPTVLATLGQSAPVEWEGRVLPRADDPATEPRPIFLETRKVREMEAVVLGNHKLVRNVHRGTNTLFDLAVDPGEHSDLATGDPETVQRLGGLLDQWAAAHPVPGELPAPVQLTDLHVVWLKGLGENLGESSNGLTRPSEGIDRFVDAWNDNDNEKLATLFSAEGERPEWKRFQEELKANGWLEERPRIRTIAMSGTRRGAVIYEFGIGRKTVEIRWVSKPQGWVLQGIRVTESGGP